ncbi:pentapeptide repeat-containing protein (plasmid) [Pseudanabaena biceps]|nr:pentapeptide repeat-containing protein [Pseudanabaena biceps]
MKKYFWVFPLLIAGFVLALWITPWVVQITNNYANLQNGKEKFEASLEIGKAIISVVGTLATIGGGVVLFLNFRVANQNLEIANKNFEQAKRKNDVDEEKSKKDIKIAESRLITDRFSKATEQLASTNLHTRLGAIYSLEGIAKDDEQYYWIVIEILSAFIRRETGVDLLPSQEKKTSKTAVDIQAALTVIIRRETKSKIEQTKEINLSGAILNEINLSEASLENINFSGANLNNINLSSASLKNMDFSRAILNVVDLSKAKLVNVKFIEAELFETGFQGATIDNSNFNAAHLTTVDLVSTKINKTTFQQVILKSIMPNKDTYFDVYGLSLEQKKDLQKRGAMICDSYEKSWTDYLHKLTLDNI